MNRIHSFLLIGVLCLVTSCTQKHKYNYVYLHGLWIDEEPAPQELVDYVNGRLEESGLQVLTKKEAKALKPSQRLEAMKIDIDINFKSKCVDADIDIENYQNDANLYDKECRVKLVEDDAFEQALDGVIERGLRWIRKNCQ